MKHTRTRYVVGGGVSEAGGPKPHVTRFLFLNFSGGLSSTSSTGACVKGEESGVRLVDTVTVIVCVVTSVSSAGELGLGYFVVTALEHVIQIHRVPARVGTRVTGTTHPPLTSEIVFL